MKKAILKIFGVAALAAGMLYNVQVFDVENGSDISLAALVNMAVAQSEIPDIPPPPPPTAPGDSTKRGEGAMIMDKYVPCARPSTNYC